MSDPIKVTIDGKEQEVVLKTDFDSTQSKLEKTERDLEDTRMEVLTPQYDAFLKSLDQKEEKKEVKEEKTPSEDEFKNLTPKQIYDRALADVEKKLDAKLSAKDKELQDKEADNTKKTVAAFASRTPDYDVYRPVMYGMSLDPKNADLTIDQLYDKAKAHVKSIQSGSTEKEKEKSRKSHNERPGNDNESFAKLKATSNEKIAQDSLDQLKAELGPIPPA
jgi:hypothetical protein